MNSYKPFFDQNGQNSGHYKSACIHPSSSAWFMMQSACQSRWSFRQVYTGKAHTMITVAAIAGLMWLVMYMHQLSILKDQLI